MAKSALAVLAALTAAVGSLALLHQGAGANADAVEFVSLPKGQSLQSNPVIAPTPASGQGMTGLSHREPPPPAALAGDAARQAAYDAEAKPGDFVTPPNVSIEH